MNEMTALALPAASNLTLADLAGSPLPSPPTGQAEPPLADSLLNFVARAMADPAVNVDKLEALLRIQREIVARDAALQFARAMAQCQAEMQPVLRSMLNTATNSRYAPLDAIDAAIRPIYTRHGFSLSFTEIPTDGATVRIACIVRCAGHTETYHLEAAADTVGPQGKPNKTPVQGVGSAVSYLRRYLTLMIFNVVMKNEDNDGNRTQPSPPGRPHIDELYALLAECSADPAARAANERSFLTRMGLEGLRSIADAQASDIPRLKNALLTKKGIMAQRRELAIRQAQQAEAARKARAPIGETA